MDNPTATGRIIDNLRDFYDFWFLATDDRPYNIISVTSEAHGQKHYHKGDTRFVLYRELNHKNDSFQWNQETGFT